MFGHPVFLFAKSGNHSPCFIDEKNWGTKRLNNLSMVTHPGCMIPEAMPWIAGQYVPSRWVRKTQHLELKSPHGGLACWLGSWSAGGFLAFPLWFKIKKSPPTLLETWEHGEVWEEMRSERWEGVQSHSLIGEDIGFILNAVGRQMRNFNWGMEMC